MGKSQRQDSEAERPVKREVVSASANLEVISEESFARRLQGMNACVNCQKERSLGSGNGYPGQNRSSRYHNKQGRRNKQGRHKQAKSNTPIVIHLKDTLRSALQNRQRSLDTDSDVSARSTDDDLAIDTFGDVSSIPEFIPQHIKHQSCPKPAFTRQSHHQEKSKKNLTALISVIEKAHHKESQNIESNLSQNKTCSKLSHLLNNAVPVLGKIQTLQRSIVKCDNVDLICNDLFDSDNIPDAICESDSVSDISSISSSSEAFSDSDSLLVDDNIGFEFTSEELQHLVDYTVGFPLYRYDCAPADCRVCMATWYSHQIYQYDGYTLDVATLDRVHRHNNSSRIGNKTSDKEVKQCSVIEEPSDNEGASSDEGTAQHRRHQMKEERQSDSSTANYCLNHQKTTPLSAFTSSAPMVSVETDSSSWPLLKNNRQLWDIDISQASRRTNQDHHDNPHTDSVYLDLTGTDVSISVYYHHSLLHDQVARAAISNAVLSPSLYATASSMLYSVCCPSYAGMPVYSLSMPLSIFNEAALPKIAMVPPHELKKFTASAPPQRQWIVSSHPDRTRPSAIFTVMCYNVLCDKYCTRQQYGYCPVWALNWEYRKKGILEDIRNLNGDIISLQEVETDQFFNFFLPELKRDGYDGIFSPKSRARTMTEQERKHVDGCAIFYKKAKFSLVEEKLVEFNQLAMANAEGSDDMLNRVMTKDNIGLAALLETKAPVFENGVPPEPHTRQLLVVATAHIHWDPEFSDVKLVQTMMLMWELQHFTEEATRKYSLPFPGPYDYNSIPLLFCGDLNSLPDSGVIEYLSNGRVAINHEDFKANVYDQCLKKMNNGDKDYVYHNFRLARAYDDVMPVTNFTYDFKGIIDYIFYSRDHLSVLGMLGPYDEEWFRQNKILGCPHPHIPSDHFSLFVEMEMPIRMPPSGRGPPLPKPR